MTRFSMYTMQVALVGALLAASQIAIAQQLPVDLKNVEVGFTPRAIAKLGDDLFILTQPLAFIFGNDATRITVPSGFITDLASIPKALHWWEGKVDRSLAPAILHDYLYWYQPCSAAEANSVMMVGMAAMEMSAAKRVPIYAAVSIAGPKFYGDNTQTRNSGQIRTLTPTFLNQVMARRMDPNESLATLLDKAKANAGLLDTEQAAPSDGAVCKAVHAACVDCN